MTEQLLGPLAERLEPEHVTPLACYLVSARSATSPTRSSRWAAAATPGCSSGSARGWVAPQDRQAALEEVRDHVKDIMNTEGFTVPASIDDEMAVLMGALLSKGP